MRVPVQIILFLNVTVLFIFLCVCYKSSPVTEETGLLYNDLALTNFAESDVNLTFGYSHYTYSDFLDHEFPNCEHRTIYNGKAEYSLPDIIKFIHKFIPPSSKFVGHLKNPCWFANYHKVMSDFNLKSKIAKQYDLSKLNDTKTLYCLPYVYLLGYPKCGTTSLFNYFKRHPEFASFSKPYGWIGLHTSGLVNKYPANVESVIELLSNFYPASRQVSTDDHSDNKIIGDFNSGNSWRQSGFEHLKNGSMCDPPLLLREIQPNAKFVVLLREPVNRLYSAFWYFARSSKKLSPEIFIEDIQTFFKRLELCDKRKSMSKCLREAQDFNHHFRDGSAFVKDPQQLRTNFYYLYLLPWLQVFPRENFLFIRTEDMKKDTAKTLQETFQFLGMSPLPKDKIDSIAAIAHNSQNNRHSNYSIMSLSSSTKKKLRAYFRPFNEKLAKLLNDDRFLWEDID